MHQFTPPLRTAIKHRRSLALEVICQSGELGIVRKLPEPRDSCVQRFELLLIDRRGLLHELINE
ncbi:hypothetical protein ACM42_16765 [Bradyrhizobium sp. CCBAU 25338]|nr:hypothetical protein [Bradyrhizobium sp. CCBAU 25338]